MDEHWTGFILSSLNFAPLTRYLSNGFLYFFLRCNQKKANGIYLMRDSTLSWQRLVMSASASSLRPYMVSAMQTARPRRIFLLMSAWTLEDTTIAIQYTIYMYTVRGKLGLVRLADFACKSWTYSRTPPNIMDAYLDKNWCVADSYISKAIW